MKVPEPLRDYVILHELAHLNHMDHSKNFWLEVEKHDPNYKAHRKKIKMFDESKDLTSKHIMTDYTDNALERYKRKLNKI